VAAGLTVMEAVVAPPGAHANVPPPADGVAVIVALDPAQIVCEVEVTVGIGFTVITRVAVAVHPASV